MIERWNITEREHWEQFKDEPFVSVDPGADGYAMGWTPYERAPVGYCHALEPELLADTMRVVKARVMIVEAQYIRSLGSANSVLELRFRQALALGWVGATMHENDQIDLHLFEVAPATWQAMQRRMRGMKGSPGRGDGIKVAIERAELVIGDEREWRKASAAQKEGMASALGIGEYWRKLTGLELFRKHEAYCALHPQHAGPCHDEKI